MDTNRSGIYGSELHLPSGAEVEAATLHVPVGETGATHRLTRKHAHEPIPERSGVLAKLDTLKSQSLSKVHEVRSNVTRSVFSLKTNMNRSLRSAKTSLRSQTSTRVSDVQTSMRNSPMKWAGIAAGAGFGLGMIGRIVQWRNKHHRAMPTLVVIERSC
ncbi:MAG TPA: hypothetical protein VHW00_01795 [Thermoanaerobaculia bacterium]|nr:hypothetical protein [Thermoanaerobaculia bacterium]